MRKMKIYKSGPTALQLTGCQSSVCCVTAITFQCEYAFTITILHWPMKAHIEKNSGHTGDEREGRNGGEEGRVTSPHI